MVRRVLRRRVTFSRSPKGRVLSHRVTFSRSLKDKVLSRRVTFSRSLKGKVLSRRVTFSKSLQGSLQAKFRMTQPSETFLANSRRRSRLACLWTKRQGRRKPVLPELLVRQLLSALRKSERKSAKRPLRTRRFKVYQVSRLLLGNQRLRHLTR
jgi:hypothetical protein